MMTILFSIVVSTTGEEADYQSARPGKVWWAYARWVYAYIFLTLMAGIICSFSAYKYAVLMKYPNIAPAIVWEGFISSGTIASQASTQLGTWFYNSYVSSTVLLGIALARMAKASNATPGRCTAPLNSTVRSRKGDLPSEVTELGSVVN